MRISRVPAAPRVLRRPPPALLQARVVGVGAEGEADSKSGEFELEVELNELIQFNFNLFYCIRATAGDCQVISKVSII